MANSLLRYYLYNLHKLSHASWNDCRRKQNIEMTTLSLLVGASFHQQNDAQFDGTIILKLQFVEVINQEQHLYSTNSVSIETGVNRL
jgi:hypothetical protein